jgi:hypothetical protein
MGSANEMIARNLPQFGFPPVTDGIVEREEGGAIILSPVHVRPFRRVVHVNAYGGRYVWERVKRGFLPGHQLLGCLELVRMGYEVALAEPLPDFYLYRNPLPHDFRILKMVRSWLGRDGILYCGHNVLHWIPMLKMLGAIKCKLVSLLYAREPLDFARAHTGVIGLTPAGTDQAKKLAPQSKVAHLGWGADLRFFRPLAYQPQWFLSCGIANRDFATLCSAAARCHQAIRVICPGLQPGLTWPDNVTLIDGGPGWVTDRTKKLSLSDLISIYYPHSAGTLGVMKFDPIEYTANGFTNLIEAMALAQPVIVTRTGALPGEIDVEATGCGLHVPPNDPQALAKAIDILAEDPERAEAMGRAGRRLCEAHYNIGRYSSDLHAFFESL